MLRACPDGQYRFLPGIGAYSSGVVAAPGHQLVHATLRAPRPYREGFALVERHLESRGRPRAALCAVELRLPAPLSFVEAPEAPGIYFLLQGDRLKIGRSKNIRARVNRSNLTFAAYDTVLLAWLPGGAREESALHGRFSRLHVRGEWFLFAGALRQYDCELRRGGGERQ